ncbi:unnamed protein product [Cylindrotheca closterium]|uniref:Photosystem II Psb31 protein domain-containing protein n=1 Tax=Cylindrotheca closterium TaxID=2856 RepID=A0AAD2G0T2_9STRA|nr:unnamed protein product [Cylindrotheca closterium]
MKFTAVISTLLVASAAAFAPATTERASTSLSMDRRAAMGAIAAAGVVALPQMASADGAISKATVQRSRYNYGSRIMDLKDAVAAGDFGAVAAEKNAFILFNSGAYPGAKNKGKKAAAIAGTNAIFAAIRSKDKGALKSAFDAYVNENGIASLAASVDSTKGQGYSTDFDYRVRTKQAAIYVR